MKTAGIFPLSLLLLDFFLILASCGTDEKSVEADTSGAQNSKVNEDKLRSVVEGRGFLNITDENPLALKETRIALHELISEKFRSWIARQDSGEVTYHCGYVKLSTDEETARKSQEALTDLKPCQNLSKSLFSASTGEFVWQPNIDNGKYIIWLAATYHDREFIKFNVQVSVDVFRVSVIEMDSVDNLEGNSGGKKIAAIGIFENSDPSLYKSGVDFSSPLSKSSESLVAEYLKILHFRDSQLYDSMGGALPLEQLLKLIPETNLTITENNIYLGAVISPVQFVSMTKEKDNYISVSLEELSELTNDDLKKLTLDKVLVKNYIENLLLVHFGSDKFGFPSQDGLTDSQRDFRWDRNAKSI